MDWVNYIQGLITGAGIAMFINGLEMSKINKELEEQIEETRKMKEIVNAWVEKKATE